MNFLNGTVQGGAVQVPGLGGAGVKPPVQMPADGTAVILGVRPQHITVDEGGDTHTVELTESLGGVSYMYLNSANGDRIIVEAHEGDPVPEGSKVGVSFDAAQSMLFDARSEARIR